MVPSVTRLPGRPMLSTASPWRPSPWSTQFCAGNSMRGGTVDRAERNLVRALARLDRRREECLVADKLLLVDQPGRDVDPAQAGINPHRRREPTRAERCDPELGEDRTGDQVPGSRFPSSLKTACPRPGTFCCVVMATRLPPSRPL